jgi:hypothetical protein
MYRHINVLKKYQYVDIKVHDLVKGSRTTRDNHWHLDSSLTPQDGEFENYLFVTGNHNLTEFSTDQILAKKHTNSFSFNKEVAPLVRNITPIKSCTITKYDGFNLHRGVKCEIPEKRLLIRLINTDTKLPIK